MSLPLLISMGDSISIQYGPHLRKCLEGFFEYQHFGDVRAAMEDLDVPAGANSGDSANVLATLRGVQAGGGLRGDVLLLNCGLHDIKTSPTTGAKQVPLEQYRENLQEIVAVVRQMNIPLIWVRTTPADEAVHNTVENVPVHRFAADVHAYNQAADAIMRSTGTPTIDLFTFTTNLGPDLYCDHVHFREPIREKQAAFIAGFLTGRCAGSIGSGRFFP